MSAEGNQLRMLLGERVPDGGSASETMFTDIEIEGFLTLAEGNMDRAAYEGWRAKAAEFASLVDTTEGNYARKYGQLLANANNMVKTYLRSSGGLTEGRARIGRIVRKDESDGTFSR